MTYTELIQRLFNINKTNGVKFGLDNMRQLSQALGNPETKFAAIHIAGTNGKGSVTTKIAYALAHQGMRVGLYTSPHISSFRERIRVNGEMIPEDSVVEILNRIFQAAEDNSIPATFFEMTTMLAFLYFYEQRVDYGVIETGLGGRLDATNIIVPELSIITSVSLDHTETLGHSIPKIAKEKAGIIKKEVPVVIGPRVPLRTIQTIAGKLRSKVWQVAGHYADFNAENNAIARSALEHLKVNANAIEEGLKNMPPCRIEDVAPKLKQKRVPDAVILDVGHNPDGLKRLFEALQTRYPHRSIRAVCGLSKNKDIEGCLAVLRKHVSTFQLVQSLNGRGLPVLDLQQKLVELGVKEDSIIIGSSIKDSVINALRGAYDARQILVVCGTFFIMSEARAALGIIEPKDPVDLNESFTLATISPNS